MTPGTWLLLVHQIPAKPLYLRARYRTLLARTGAVALKNSVYALPKREGALAALDSLAAGIRRDGGEAFVCEVRFTDPEDETRVTESFREHRRLEYRRIQEEAESLRERAPGAAAGRQLAKLRERMRATRALDHFAAPGRAPAESALERAERRGAEPGATRRRGTTAGSPWAGRTWVTRRGVHVDRIACAWFIRRFLDPSARFRFLAAPDAPRRPGELAFDLPGAEFAHEGGRCSFETLIAKTGRSSPALERIAGVVHDIDLKDGKFAFPETAGIEQVLSGLVASESDDDIRLGRGATLFDDLHRSLARPPALSRAGVTLRRPVSRPGARRPKP